MSIFHRYKSEIHGNYRIAYLRSGLLTGVLLATYVLVRLLAGSPVESPFSLIVALFLLTAWYRASLPDKKITLKEAMLFGIGTAVVAGIVYGLLLWVIGIAFPTQTLLFNTSSQQSATNPYPLQYWAAWWAILAGLETMLLGSFGAFIAAILFRNEKSEYKHK